MNRLSHSPFSCGRGHHNMGIIWSFFFGRTLVVNGQNYKVIRRIGEGGKCPCYKNIIIINLGFSYVDLVRGRDGQQYALVSINISLLIFISCVLRNNYCYKLMSRDNHLKEKYTSISQQIILMCYN